MKTTREKANTDIVTALTKEIRGMLEGQEFSDVGTALILLVADFTARVDFMADESWCCKSMCEDITVNHKRILKNARENAKIAEKL